MSFGGGGGGGTQTVRTELDPAMRPFVEYGLREAQGLYQAGPMQYYPGQTYVGPSATTQTGMQAAANLAQQRATYGTPLVQGAQQTVGALQTALNPALGAYGDVYGRAMYDPSSGVYQQLAGGGMSDVANMQRASNLYNQAGYDPAQGIYGQFAGGGMADAQTQQRLNQLYGQAGAGDPSAGFYSSVAGGAARDALNAQRANQIYGQAAQGDPSSAFYQQLTGGQFGNAAFAPTQQTAAGSYLGGNPFFQGAFAPAARAAQDVFEQGIQGVSSQASRAGRYGSGAMGQLQDRASGQFAQSLSDVAGQLAYQNYAAERGLQEAAMGRLGALSQQDIQNRISGAQGLSTGAQQTLANQMAAMQASAGLSQQDFANRMAGAQNLSTAAQQTLQNQLQLAQAGGAQRQQDLANQMAGAQALTQGARAGQAERMAAMQASANLSQQDVANRLTGAQALTQSQQQGIANQLAAAGGLGQTAQSDFARQLQAAAMAPELAAQDFADIQRLIDLGQMQEGYQELALADAMNRFNFQQAAPYQSLQSYLSAAFGAPMGTQTSQPIFRNQVGSGLSGALAGAGLAGAGGFSPYLGAALGGGLGLLGS